MKNLFIIFIFLCFFKLPCFSQSQLDKVNYINDLTDLTRDGLQAYITLNIKNSNNSYSKILLRNMDLYILQYKNLSFAEDFPDTLKKILEKDFYVATSKQKFKELKKYAINMKIYQGIQKKLSPIQVYDKYFSNMGVPLYDKFSTDEIEACIAFLIDNFVIVYQGKYNTHDIYVPPK